MKAVLITAFASYEPRVSLVRDVFNSLGIETQFVVSDFDHLKKDRRCAVPDGAVSVPTMFYKRNFSLGRILSHRRFAKDVAHILNNLSPDVIYATVPPNFLTKELALYKTRNPKVKLIFDVLDMWPEAFPRRSLKVLFSPLFFLWKRLRDDSLLKADLVLTECELFRASLKLAKAKTIYWTTTRFNGCSAEPELSDELLEIAYLGSINNIIDIKRIEQFVRDLTRIKPVTVHVIGTGEKKSQFLFVLRRAKATVIDHGVVFEDEKKAEIFRHCHVGLNIMKESVFVGLSMKSLEYMKFGLPIVNSLSGDTRFFIQKENIGFNLSDNTVSRLSAMTRNENLMMRLRVKETFEAYFESSHVRERITTVLIDFLKERNGKQVNCFPDCETELIG